MSKQVVTFLLFFIFRSAGASSGCENIRGELKMMQKAQGQVIGSLLQNHDLFANSLEEYSSLHLVSPKGSRVLSQQMSETAKTFRQRGIQGKKVVENLNSATGNLVDRILMCLKN